MARLTSTSSPHLAVDAGTFCFLHDTSPEVPIQRQSYSPMSNCYLGTFPLHDPSVPNPAAVPEFRSFPDPLDMSPPFPNYPGPRFQEPVAHNTIPVMISVGPLCTFTHVYQPHLHQLDETTPEAPSVPSPSGFPYFSAPPTTPHPATFPEPLDIPLSSASLPDQTQFQAMMPPPSAPATFHGFGAPSETMEEPVAYAAPQAPAAAANPTADHPSTHHPCQCVKADGSPCNAQVRGNKQSVREHLKAAHAFNGAARDTVTCPWACGKTLKRENVPRHIVTCHLHVKSRCVGCGAQLSRPDVQHSHARSCPARRRIGSRLDPDVSRSGPRSTAWLSTPW